MIGFTNKALLLGPDPSACDGRPAAWKSRYAKTVHTLMQYCIKCGIDAYYLVTDEMMYTCPSIVNTEAKCIATLGRGDMHFLSQHNIVYASYQYRDLCEDYRDVINLTMDKIPMDPENKTDDARITCVLKRESRVAKAVIKDFNMVFNIQFGSPKQYKTETKSGDCRLVGNIDAKTFQCDVEMSGQHLSPIDIFEIRNANLPVFEWEV